MSTSTPQPLTINTRGQYAVMAMVELAKAEGGRPLPLSEIAGNAGISLSYLEQLIAGMRRHGLVRSYRGPGGGYILGKSTNEILVADILVAAEDSTPARRTATNSPKSKTCTHTKALWNHIGQLLGVTLQQITLQDVINQNLESNPHTSKVFEVLAKTA